MSARGARLFSADSRSPAARRTLPALFAGVAHFAGLVLLSACNEDGSANGSVVETETLRPTASFGASPLTGDWPLVVAFDGSASSDPDGTIARHSWSFGDGESASGPTASHTYGEPGTYTARLQVVDDQGATGSATQSIVVTGPVTLSGRITYDRVPFGSTGNGLDYTRTTRPSARGIVVELVDAGGSVLATTVTGSDGRYQFTAEENTDFKVRARAKLLRTSAAAGEPGWDVEILDNTSASAPWVFEGPLQNSGPSNQTRNLNAPSGWPTGGTSYTGTRAAAPFAIADTLYTVLQFMTTKGDTAEIFAPFDVFWSPGNSTTVGDDDWSDGEIGRTRFRAAAATGSPAGIYVLGEDGVDTDEYDAHMLARVFLERTVATKSRSDSIGGAHVANDLLDLRVAWSEGLADAFAAMALGNSVVRNSMGEAQGEDEALDVEGNTWRDPGWANEGSVASILFDLYDTVADAPDATSIPFSTLYDVLKTDVAETPALTSVFAFLDGLRGRSSLDVEEIDAIVANQAIVAATLDAYGSTETNDGTVAEALPIYTQATLGGGAVQVCGSADADAFGNFLGNRRFLRFEVPSTRAVTIQVVGLEQGVVDTPAPNPDLSLYRAGFLAESICTGPTGGACNQPTDTERYSATLDAGDYVLEVYDRSHVDDTDGIRPTTCMNVTLSG